MSTQLTPPPERDLDPERRAAIRSVLGEPVPPRRTVVPLMAAAAVLAVVGAAAIVVPRLGGDHPGPGGGPGPGPAPTTKTTTSGPGLGEGKPTVNPSAAATVCRKMLTGYASANPQARRIPGAGAQVRATTAGRWGTTLILADGKYWVGCDTAGSSHNGGSLREPGAVARPSSTDNDAFAVSEYMQSETWTPESNWYDYFWAAGIMPAGVGGIRYTFPDGKTQAAVVNGMFWTMQHSFDKPWVQGQDLNRPPVKVTLIRPDGSVLRSFELEWGKQTCAHVNHGC
jgi:hypothetical protein